MSQKLRRGLVKPKPVTEKMVEVAMPWQEVEVDYKRTEADMLKELKALGYSASSSAPKKMVAQMLQLALEKEKNRGNI